MKLNHTLKLAALTAVGLLSLDLMASAQDAASTNAPAAGTPPPMTRPARAHRLTPDQLVKELGLTDDVATKFKAILTDSHTQIGALRTDTTLSMEDRRAKVKEINDTATAKIKDLLTPDQFTKYKTLAPTGQRRVPTAPPAAAPSN